MKMMPWMLEDLGDWIYLFLTILKRYYLHIVAYTAF